MYPAPLPLSRHWGQAGESAGACGQASSYALLLHSFTKSWIVTLVLGVSVNKLLGTSMVRKRLGSPLQGLFQHMQLLVEFWVDAALGAYLAHRV